MDDCCQRLCAVNDARPCLLLWRNGECKKYHLHNASKFCVALGVISVVWVFVGFSLAFGDSFYGIIGNPSTYMNFDNVTLSPHPEFGSSIPFLLFALFQLKFAIITPALISGSFAERIRFRSYILFMLLFTLLIYSPLPT